MDSDEEEIKFSEVVFEGILALLIAIVPWGIGVWVILVKVLEIIKN